MTIGTVNDDECIRGSLKSPYAYGDYILIPVCIRGLHDMRSPYAYGDQDQSPYAFRECKNPPRMHTGILCHVIPVCIRGFICNPRMHTGIDLDPCMHTGFSRSLNAYGDWLDTNPRMHTGFFASLYAGDFSVTPRMHNEVVRIWEV